ncbi:MAG: BrnA antitoxin family protein [Bdellovibrio sp.]|nr:BrnA antitoxin family protein [Bdellovibrio sp.]
MKKSTKGISKNWRKVTPSETAIFREMIEKKLGVKRPKRGRPPKAVGAKMTPISIRVHPKVLSWAKKEAKRRGVGYQTVINDVLLKAAA